MSMISTCWNRAADPFHTLAVVVVRVRRGQTSGVIRDLAFSLAVYDPQGFSKSKNFFIEVVVVSSQLTLFLRQMGIMLLRFDLKIAFKFVLFAFNRLLLHLHLDRIADIMEYFFTMERYVSKTHRNRRRQCYPWSDDIGAALSRLAFSITYPSKPSIPISGLLLPRMPGSPPLPAC